jgi:hypothetical protein
VESLERENLGFQQQVCQRGDWNRQLAARGREGETDSERKRQIEIEIGKEEDQGAWIRNALGQGDRAKQTKSGCRSPLTQCSHTLSGRPAQILDLEEKLLSHDPVRAGYNPTMPAVSECDANPSTAYL